MPPLPHARPSAAEYLIAATEAEVTALQQLLRMTRLVVAISALVHALQRERGATTIYTGSAGQQFRRQRSILMQGTDEELARFEAALAELEAGGPMVASSRVLSHIAFVLHHLAELPAVRERSAVLEIEVQRASQFYSELIHSLLAVVFEAAETATDPAVARALVALSYFMQGKELAGQERALGGILLATGGHRGGEGEQMSILREGQDRCFDIFADTADSAPLAAWQRLLAGPEFREVEQLRQELLKGALVAGGTPQSCEPWFAAGTRRIDAMKAIEDALELRVKQVSEFRLAVAREQLVLDQRQLAEQPVAQPMVSGASPRQPQSGAQLTPVLSRTVLELLSSQNQRLQRMQEDLERARAALEERKLLDRAKVLLIKQHRMTEAQAHALLRRTAMNQNRRLEDVARALLDSQFANSPAL